MKRSFFFALMVGCLTSAALASFELVMVADPVANKIHRFDGTTGAYFGSFGALNGFNGACTAMVVNQARNEVVVNQGPILRRYNYNTGEFIGFKNSGINISQMSISRDGKSIFVFNRTNNIYRFDANTLSLAQTYTFSGNYVIHSGAENQAGSLVCMDVFNPTTMFTRRFNLDQTVNGGFSIGSTQVPGQMTATPTIDLTGILGPGQANMGVVQATSGAAMISGISPLSGNPVGYYAIVPDDFSGAGLKTSSLTATGAHQGMYFGGVDAGGFQQVFRYDPTFTFLNRFGAGIIQSQVAIGSVLAPEPGTMIALGAGVAALVRRRRPRT